MGIERQLLATTSLFGSERPRGPESRPDHLRSGRESFGSSRLPCCERRAELTRLVLLDRAVEVSLRAWAAVIHVAIYLAIGRVSSRGRSIWKTDESTPTALADFRPAIA